MFDMVQIKAVFVAVGEVYLCASDGVHLRLPSQPNFSWCCCFCAAQSRVVDAALDHFVLYAFIYLVI